MAKENHMRRSRPAYQLPMSTTLVSVRSTTTTDGKHGKLSHEEFDRSMNLYRHRYNRLDEPLQVVMRSLSLDEGREKTINETLHKLLDGYLVPQMRDRDPLFNKLYVQLHYMGSYYEGLRIKEPNEFDLNVELRLPVACKERVTRENCPPGFLKIKCESSEEIPKWISVDGFLIREKVLDWMKGVVDKALKNISIPNVQIRRSTSGPAVTLDITYSNTYYSVDLVPVLTFNLDQWPGPPVRQPHSTDSFPRVSAPQNRQFQRKVVSWPHDSTNSFSHFHSGRKMCKNKPIRKEDAVHTTNVWNAVPKGPMDFGYGDTSKYWRMSFYNQEKKIMNNLGLMKPSIKLMKLLRDKEGWHKLSSYYIKTVALWVNESNTKLWQSSLGVVFMELLSEFKTYFMDKKTIPFFWDRRHNLLSGVSPMEIDKIGNRIAKIINKIDQTLENNPEQIDTLLYDLFGTTKSSQFSQERPRVNNNSNYAASGNRTSTGASTSTGNRTSTGASTSTGTSTTAVTVGLGALAVGAVAVGAFLALAPSRRRRD